MSPLSLASRGRVVFTLFCSLLLGALAGRAQPLNETILYNFSTNDFNGSSPSGGVILGQDGALYGTANYGGTNGYGLVFRINRNGGYSVLHVFSAFSNGAYPNNLLQGTNGILYGPLGQGGTNGFGAIFELNTNGTGYAQVHAMAQSEGIYPGSLFLASNSVFYGCASEGGISNAGTVFRMNLDGSGFQVLHQFTKSPDGAGPVGVILANDGALYGMTSSGGAPTNAGIVFKMNTNGNNYTILHSFTNSPDGAQPAASLIQGKDGMLYGTTSFGGSVYIYGGVLFKIATNGGGYTVLHSFPSIADDGDNPAALIQDPDGFIYGNGFNGGHSGIGAIFKTDTNAANFSIVYSFGNSPDGQNPGAPLVDPGDGAFYGTANNGGASSQGTIFRLAPQLLLSSQISTAGGTNKTTLSWPLWATDYGVRTSPSLASNATWTALAAPVTNGSKLYATNTSIAPSAFFRLQSPP